MGVPKFFRWMSQRYPCLSEVVKDYQIPEFDNLYLDMNGIIHPCSHPDDSNPHFRITEEDIFKNIFHYIEVLFRMIRPQKVFFMAVDGVAPRAKMNQQRGRRFRSVREAQDREREALNRNETLPTEQRFDSNCITPGTGFMVRLNEQLRYFVARKISTDPMWQGLRVILSGHDVPGEGEHKVMDFIRFEKSLPDYDHNTRHCLYGLDADLIILGLCTHEPLFSLLREEVLFTRTQAKRTTVPEEMTFYLLHLSLFREYLEYEFSSLKDQLPFPFDLERIIDDWVMLTFLVGNDFVPHLPNLHIKEEALPLLYSTYKKVLPTLDGYINDGGTLVLERFEALMVLLTEWELERLDDSAADKRWLRGKQQTDVRTRGPVQAELEQQSRDAFAQFSERRVSRFEELDVSLGGEQLQPTRNKSVFSEIHTNIGDELEDGDESMAELEYRQLRRHYYKSKMNIDITPETALCQAVEYVRAVQWILHYYFNGVCSWSWFYPAHYSPYTGDVRGFVHVPDVVHFDYGQPFLPYEQLLAVLPAASQESLPPCLRQLMTSENSPIIEYYPTNYETDLNGKQQDWEAVVLIPFIDQERLLAAIQPLYARLEPDESARNVHGDANVFTYTTEDQGRTESPGYFPPLERTLALMEPRPRETHIAAPHALRKGLLPNTWLGKFFVGYPTLKHVPHSFHLSRQKVKVFSMPSNGDSMILTVTDRWDGAEPDAELEARRLLGRDVFVRWPHMIEARVVAVSSIERRYTLQPGSDQLVTVDLTDVDRTLWIGQMHDVKHAYEGRRGIVTGDIPLLVYATPMTGRKYAVTGADTVTLEKQWSPIPRPYALHMCVRELATRDSARSQYSTLHQLFSVGSVCFVTATDSYGAMGKVIGVTDKGRVRLEVELTAEPDFSPVEKKQSRLPYFPGYVVAQKLGISSHLVSRLTGCIMLQQGASRPRTSGNVVGELQEISPSREAKFNCAIEVKHNKKNEELPGWSRRVNNSWQYSAAMVDTLREYISKFPELIEFLGLNTEGFKFLDGDIWSDPKTRASRMTELREWLRALPCLRAERWPCDGQMLEQDLVRELELTLDAHRPPAARTRLSVKPHLLYKPTLLGGSAAADPAAQYRLYDRVINVREGFSVPLAAKGTVIGIRQATEPADVLYDVLFDQPFPGGLPIRCSPGRGYKMAPFSLINISHGLRLKRGEVRPRAAATVAAATAGPASTAAAGGAAAANGARKQFSHSPGSPFHEMPRASAHAQSPDTAQQRGRAPAAVPVNGRVVPKGNSPRHVGSGRLAHLTRQPAPATPPLVQNRPAATPPTAGDQFSDIWRELQRQPPSAVTAPIRAGPTAQQAASPAGPVASTAHTDMQPAAGAEKLVYSCQRLLERLQHSDGGVPRYTFTAAPGGKFVATVLLPAGRAFQSEPAPSRDQAAELAAAAAMTRLGSSAGPAAAPAAAPAPAPAPAAAAPKRVVKRPPNGADLLHLLRSPVRATLPPAPQPPPADLTHTLLRMLSTEHPACATAEGATRTGPEPASQPVRAGSRDLNQWDMSGRAGQSRVIDQRAHRPAGGHQTGSHGHQVSAGSHQTGSHGHQVSTGSHQTGSHGHQVSAGSHQTGGRGHQVSAGSHQTGGRGHQVSASAANGSLAGQQSFVPMQVTKKVTPRKKATDGESTSTPTAEPTSEGAPPLAAAAETAAEAAPAAVNQTRPAGSGRLLRRAPRRSRLACKF